MRWFSLPAIALGLAVSVGGCAPPSDTEVPVGDTYLAFASSFKGFRTWESFPVDDMGDDVVHIAGPRTEYLNQRPEAGDTTFPVKTIVVKESEDVAALADRKVFAMVKRGGDYNSKGATGWEWFELKNIDEENVDIVWRGVGPPAGEMYGGDPNAGCNGCHVGDPDNDFVLSAGLDLEAL